jgi:iron complex transport system permease protein
LSVYRGRVQSVRKMFLWGTVIAALCLAGSFFLGRYPEPYLTPISALRDNELARSILLHLRLPRILAAFMLGMTLSAAGAVFQMIFRNPLVEAGLLGVSQGAAFGASLAIVALGGRTAAIQICAALFAFVGLGASAFLARRIRLGDWVLRLILAGIAVSALYTAGAGFLKYLADPLRQLPDITFWLLGGLWGITWPDIFQIVPVVFPCLSILHLMRWRLNLLAMEDETSFSLISSAGRERFVMLLAAVAATATVVSKAGQIGWVGLIVPHMARKVVGSDAQWTVPVSMLFGGCFALLCDNLARTLLTGEIPLGILTSFVGAALFLVLLMRRDIKVKS